MELITKTHFDAAHRLTFHKGKCKNLHGHRWVVEIHVGSDRFKDMLVDFGTIKEWVREKFDHKVLVYDQDDQLMQASTFFDRTVLDFETTAENLALYIKAELINLVFAEYPQDAAVALMVTLYETPDNYVRI